MLTSKKKILTETLGDTHHVLGFVTAIAIIWVFGGHKQVNIMLPWSQLT